MLVNWKPTRRKKKKETSFMLRFIENSWWLRTIPNPLNERRSHLLFQRKEPRSLESFTQDQKALNFRTCDYLILSISRSRPRSDVDNVLLVSFHLFYPMTYVKGEHISWKKKCPHTSSQLVKCEEELATLTKTYCCRLSSIEFLVAHTGILLL